MGRHLDYYAANRVDICNVAVSGSTLATNWLPSVNWPSGGTNLFNQMVTIVNAAAASFGSSIAAFVWIQGEGDAADSTMASNYQTNLTALFNAVRAQWPGVPIVFNQLSNSNSGAFKATVRTAQSNVAGAFSSCTMIGVDDLTLTDGQHFNADSYAALGDRLGSALVTALGLASPVSWTIDPYSLIGTPSTEAEVIAMLAAAGITWPGGNMGLWLCQETSGNLTDSSNAGAFGMTAGGTGTTYATSNINWQRKELFFPEGTTGVFSTTSASLPDPSTTGQFRIGYVFLGAATTVKRNVFVIGTAGFTTLGRDPTAPGTFWQLTDGANTTADTSHAVTGSFRPWVLARRKAAGTIDAYVDNAHISGTLGTVTGKKAFIGAGSNPLHAVNWVLDLYGSGAEFSTAQTRTILNTLNWGNTNLGASAIPW